MLRAERLGVNEAWQSLLRSSSGKEPNQLWAYLSWPIHRCHQRVPVLGINAKAGSISQQSLSALATTLNEELREGFTLGRGGSVKERAVVFGDTEIEALCLRGSHAGIVHTSYIHARLADNASAWREKRACWTAHQDTAADEERALRALRDAVGHPIRFRHHCHGAVAGRVAARVSAAHPSPPGATGDRCACRPCRDHPARAGARRGARPPRRRGPRLAGAGDAARGPLLRLLRGHVRADLLHRARLAAELADRRLGAGDGLAGPGQRRRRAGPRRLGPAPRRHGRRPDRPPLGRLLPDQERRQLRRRRRVGDGDGARHRRARPVAVADGSPRRRWRRWRSPPSRRFPASARAPPHARTLPASAAGSAPRGGR